MPGRTRVTAVTSLDDDVYIARWRSDHVEVYHAVTFQFQGRITVAGLRSVQGLAVCARHQCLYVSETTHQRVHRADLRGGGLPTDWTVSNYPCGLSVNKSHNVVVACRLADKLEEYTTRGSFVREIRLTLKSPSHAVQLSTGAYAVSHSRTLGVVSVVAADDGRVVSRYPPSLASDVGPVGPLRDPSSVAVKKNGDILVTAVSYTHLTLPTILRV